MVLARKGREGGKWREAEKRERERIGGRLRKKGSCKWGRKGSR